MQAYTDTRYKYVVSIHRSMLLLTNKLFYIYLLYFQELDVIKDPIERQATDAWLKLANDKGVCIALFTKVQN